MLPTLLAVVVADEAFEDNPDVDEEKLQAAESIQFIYSSEISVPTYGRTSRTSGSNGSFNEQNFPSYPTTSVSWHGNGRRRRRYGRNARTKSLAITTNSSTPRTGPSSFRANDENDAGLIWFIINIYQYFFHNCMWIPEIKSIKNSSENSGKE